MVDCDLWITKIAGSSNLSYVGAGPAVKPIIFFVQHFKKSDSLRVQQANSKQCLKFTIQLQITSQSFDIEYQTGKRVY